ncbi:MAG: RagB/SusD family nutrient uptake outer membrane protein [Bacteroidales bacterium]|nr:RagB/SusD family nutrient uptake outer membrane protein [Bacteroidales bacterium]
MKKIIFNIITLIILTTLMSSCLKVLDTVPLDEDEVTSAGLFEDATAYKQFLAKVYAGLTLTGQQGPAGLPDIDVADEGFSSYLRQLWVHQEIPTDEAVVAWGDPGLPEFNYQAWTSGSDFVEMMYYRIFYQITLCNEFIRESSDEKLDERGFSDADKTLIQEYKNEARFLRAFSYWHALDMFGSVPFVTEENATGAFLPEQISKAELFKYIEDELLEVKDLLKASGANEYGRIDRVAAWTLLAKIYLNAQVYVSSDRYSDCITYCNEVINSTYSLDDNYQDMFLANNHTSPEIIFGIPHDGISSFSYGGTTFIVHAGIGGTMNDVCESEYGVDGGWGGHRVTPEFVSLFPDVTGDIDGRAKFYTDGQNLEINDVGSFTDGYAIDKYRNVIYTGTDTVAGSNLTFMDIDFPMFRLADVYLMYAEAHLRGGGGDAGTAVGYVNDLRERAYGDASGNISTVQLNHPNFILDERARELYWEGKRRTDLIRFGLFTGNSYLWSWKGEVQEGTSTDAKYNVFPIPSAEMNANPNLVQNPGY